MPLKTHVKTRAKKQAEIKFKKIRKSFFGAAKGVGPFTKEDELKARE